MDYPLEQLDPERFQHVCQALLVKEFPRLQCFPVGQADGGRDAWQPILTGGRSRKFILFQVKFARYPAEIKDPVAWLKGSLMKELPSIEKYASRVQEYVLLTNVRGTASDEVGKIDRVQDVLQNVVPVAAQCWWRDDLNRRLDSAWDLKWSYPELLTGPDLLRLLLETRIPEDTERRLTTIRAAIATQYEQECEVRFKQVELQNRLLDLFVDVPLVPPRHQLSQQPLSAYEIYQSLVHAIGAPPADTGKHEILNLFDSHEERYALGAGTFLLAPLTQMKLPWIVLEGAPGQGKSTITQYICQVHRIRLLHKHDDLTELTPTHQSSPLRLPIRVDLRDFAIWLEGKDPFSADIASGSPPERWYKSLDAFLAAQISHLAGGANFDIGDLHSVTRIAPLLLVLDGLDEVADISVRSAVVEELHKGVQRLSSVASSLQVVITSRPAAFANSPGMPRAHYQYLELGSVTHKLIKEYASRWSRARRLGSRETGDLLRILDEKLSQPHLRELARNPMQLAILLSLIHTRGTSLPDKRTALYDTYVELFFNREAEKSWVVREYRDLLIDIHQFLAWYLHADSELGNTSGRLPSEKLVSLMRAFLEEEGHDPELAQNLFRGAVERVVALVSRVEGTYEFEVQPLREYFAARFLYNTAPYSPPGAEKTGTKPERFEALARNSYWLNVTRFYAGCYSKGELPSLIEGLFELASEDPHSLLVHPRILAATLLADWVFSQHPKSVKQVIGLILDDLGLRYLLAAGGPGSIPGQMILGDQFGRQELLRVCMKVLESNAPRDYALSVANLARNNATPTQSTLEWWIGKTRGAVDQSRDDWLEYGLVLGHIGRCSTSLLDDLLQDENAGHALIACRAGRYDWVAARSERLQTTLKLILGGGLRARRSNRARSVLETLASVLDPYLYAMAFHSAAPVPLRTRWHMLDFEDTPEVLGMSSLPEKNLDSRVHEFVSKALELANRPASEWATKLDLWLELVEAGRSCFNDQWVFYRLAAVGSGVRSALARGEESSSIAGDAQALVLRARYMRLRAGKANWWARELTACDTEDEQVFRLLMLLAWGSANCLLENIEQVNSLAESLPLSRWRQLCEAVRTVVGVTTEQQRQRYVSFPPARLPKTIGTRGAILLLQRADHPTKMAVYRRYLRNCDLSEGPVAQFCLESAFGSLLEESAPELDLEVIRKAYLAGAFLDRHHRMGMRELRNLEIPVGIAREICRRPAEYPATLLAFAEERLRGAVSKDIQPVGRVAEQQQWFRGRNPWLP